MTDGLDRFAELKRLAAETCGAATDDARVELMAAVRLAFERQVEALAAGQRIDYTAFTKTVEMLDKYAPPPKIEAKLVVMHKNYDVAPQRTSPATPTAATPAAPTSEAGKPEATPRSDNPSLRVIDGEIVTDGPSSVKQASTPTADVPAASAAPVYPRRDPSKLGIHDAPLPNGQPARMRRNDYIAINAGGACSPLEKAPDWSAAHPLPSPPPERLK